MSEEKMVAIVQRLLDRTQHGQVDWTESELALSDYAAHYPNYSVTLEYDEDAEEYTMNVFDTDGESVDSLTADVSDYYYPMLKQLYDIAERISEAGSDENLDELLGEIG